ncbi:Midnolin homolog [Eumeta japonica]|uniref:Midnolin homolog n=1 Tax=Eumeta variegata TaxID=151549 RepID=A0A4C1T7K7_EUMVA|nr:Midnolin homolog [Eumeta japonica]
MERGPDSEELFGCGEADAETITLNVQTTTGMSFTVTLNQKHSVSHLKKLVSKNLKVSKDRICLLHRERVLTEGTLEENGLQDGARVILLPSVETGLLSQRSENSVMQALESLNDTQVNDFLSGKSPLNLTMRLGDHMMLIQLQLSTVNSPNSSSRSSKASGVSRNTRLSPGVSVPSRGDSDLGIQRTPEKSKTIASDILLDNNVERNASESTKTNESSPTLQKKDLQKLQKAFNFFKSIAKDNTKIDTEKNNVMDYTEESFSKLPVASTEVEQSPIKSLSNLVSSPLHASASENKKHISVKPNAAFADTMKTSLIDMLASDINNDRMDVNEASTSCLDKTSSTDKSSEISTSLLTPDSPLSDDSDTTTELNSFLTESTIDEYPMENLFNNAVDKGLLEEKDNLMDREISNLVTTSHGSDTDGASKTLPSFQTITEPLKTKRFHCLLHKTSKFKHPVGQSKQRAFMQSIVNKHKKRMQNRQDNSQSSSSHSNSYITSPRKLILQPSNSHDEPQPSTSKAETIPKLSDTKPNPPDTKTLIEASKNLTQTLKKLSKEVLTNKIDFKSTEEKVRAKIGPGAVIESMKHHGKGIYSGTFSGTLNPALQDRFGRPKRDISTIIHILNDLLCAHPPITLSQNETKHTCAKAVTTDNDKCTNCSSNLCSYGQCNGHPSTSTTAPKIGCVCIDKNHCLCSTRLSPDCIHCKEKQEICNKCNSAKILELENSKTKGKLEQLRLVMQQKKERREARKLKAMPYSGSPPKTLNTSEQSPTLQEEIEALA